MHPIVFFLLPFWLALALVGIGRADIPPDQAGLVSRGFIYESAPFPECHASTIAETPGGLVAAWFGGLEEKDPSVGIWVARQAAGVWSEPVEVADGVQAEGKRLPCWNPVLWQAWPGDAKLAGQGVVEPLLLFYKVGPSPSTWWGMVKRSEDGGRTWSAAERLPDGVLGPIKNKPVRLADGTLVCPSSTESADGKNHWRVHFELTRDLGKTWTRVIPPAGLPGAVPVNVIQPSVLIERDPKVEEDRVLIALGRSRGGKLFETQSSDGGRTWSPVVLTEVPNPSSGTDAVTLADGRHLLVYNPVPKGRTPLSVALSKDGRVWNDVLVLENDPGEYSYPAVIQAADGRVHITYTWKRQRLRYVVLDPAKWP
ncbi:MAG: exo-alpha-sialidase [Verrucomicrobiales bacterium]